MDKTKVAELDKTTKIVKRVIAEQIGVEPEDVHLSDKFTEELHMRPTDLSDLLENLKNANLDTKDVDLSEIETVEDLITVLDSPEI